MFAPKLLRPLTHLPILLQIIWKSFERSNHNIYVICWSIGFSSVSECLILCCCWSQAKPSPFGTSYFSSTIRTNSLVIAIVYFGCLPFKRDGSFAVYEKYMPCNPLLLLYLCRTLETNLFLICIIKWFWIGKYIRSEMMYVRIYLFIFPSWGPCWRKNDSNLFFVFFPPHAIHL